MSPDDILPEAGVLDITKVGDPAPDSLLVLIAGVPERSIDL